MSPHIDSEDLAQLFYRRYLVRWPSAVTWERMDQQQRDAIEAGVKAVAEEIHAHRR
jgi:hypothetical protein